MTRDWRGTLDANNTWDRNEFTLRGDTHFRVRWTRATGLELWVANSSGRVVVHRKRAARPSRRSCGCQPGGYTVTLATSSRARTSYEVRVETESGG